MKKLPELPQEITIAIGTDASNKLVDYLEQIFSTQKESITSMSVEKFENRLTQEVSGLKLEFAELRSEFAELRAETRTEIAELRGETRAGISELRAEMKADFADVHKEIAGVHKQIATLPRWIIGGIMLAITLHPIITGLVAKLLR